MENTDKTIFTIGHSTHPPEDFVAMLRSFSISLLADVRSFPGSKRYPHFNREVLETSMTANNIGYVHPFTSAARIVDGELRYDETGLC